VKIHPKDEGATPMTLRGVDPSLKKEAVTPEPQPEDAEPPVRAVQSRQLPFAKHGPVFGKLANKNLQRSLRDAMGQSLNST
jgi:hypothetical protein